MIIYAILICLLVPGIAFASDGSDMTFWQTVLLHVIEIAVVVATPSLLLIARKIAVAFADKTGVEVSERHLIMMNNILSQGISFAHEQGRKALKGGSAMPSEEKKKAAVEFVAAEIKAAGLVEQSRDHLEHLVESRLNSRRDDPVQEGKVVITNGDRPVATATEISKLPPPPPKEA